MTSTFTVSNPRWVKVALVAVFALVVSAGLFFVGAAFIESGWARRLTNAVLAVFFGWMALPGVPLLRFMHHSMAVSGDTVRILHGGAQLEYPISSLRFDVHYGEQFVDVRLADGTRIFAADVVARHGRQLVLLAETVQMHERIRRNLGKPRITKAQFAMRYAQMERWDRYHSFEFWAWAVTGLAVAWFWLFSGLANVYKVASFGMLIVLGIWTAVSVISLFVGGGNTAKRFGVLCGSCEGGLVGPAGLHAVATGICPHCGLEPFDPQQAHPESGQPPDHRAT